MSRWPSGSWVERGSWRNSPTPWRWRREAGPGESFITLAGELLAADGTLSVGPRHASLGLISRRSELRALRVQLAGLEADVQQAQTAILRLDEQIAQDGSGPRTRKRNAGRPPTRWASTATRSPPPRSAARNWPGSTPAGDRVAGRRRAARLGGPPWAMLARAPRVRRRRHRDGIPVDRDRPADRRAGGRRPAPGPPGHRGQGRASPRR